MIRRTAITLAAALLATPALAAPTHHTAGAPAAGAPTAGDPDVKCLLVASALGQNPDPKARNLSTLMVFYYLGRIDARRPGLNLRAALGAEAATATQANMQPVGQACISAFNSRGMALQAMSGKPAAPPATPAPAPAPAAAPAPAPAPH